MKNKKNKIILIVVACFILVLMLLGAYFIGYPYYQLSKILDPKTEKIHREYAGEYKNSIENLNVFEEKDGNVCVVNSNHFESIYNSYYPSTQICPYSYLFFQDIIMSRKDILNREDTASRFVNDIFFFN